MNSQNGTAAAAPAGSPIHEKRQVRDNKEKQLEAQVAMMGGSKRNVADSKNPMSDKDAMQRLAQKIALMEFQAKEAVERYQGNGEKVEDSDVFNELPALKDHVQDLDLLRNLKSRLQAGENEIMELTAKCGTVNDVQFQLTGARRVIKVLEDKLNKADKEKQEVNGKKANVEFCLTEARRLAKFMETRAVSVLEDKKALELKLTAESKKLQFQLTEATRISKWLEQSLIAARKEKADAELDATAKQKNLQFKLTETGRISQFVQGKLAQSEEAKKELEGKIKTLEFKLCESNRISSFVQAKLLKTVEDKTAVETKVTELERELRSTQLRLDLKNSLIESSRVEAEKASQDSVKYQGQLNVAQKMAEFLQGALCRSEEEKLSSSDTKYEDLNTQVESLKEELLESNKNAKSLVDSLSLAEDEMRVTHFRIQDLEMEVQELTERLATKLHKAMSHNDRFEDQEDKIRKLTKELEEAKNTARAIPADKPIGDGYNALVDLEFQLTRSEVAKQAMQNELSTLKEENQAALNKVRELERKLAAK